jgi:hypothetical protein
MNKGALQFDPAPCVRMSGSPFGLAAECGNRNGGSDGVVGNLVAVAI